LPTNEVITPNILNTKYCIGDRTPNPVPTPIRNGGTCGTLTKLRNVNVVMTPDRSKWSRCVVVETATTAYTDGLTYPNLLPDTYTGMNEKQFHLRKGTSLDVNGNPETGNTGMSWFPGYAYDVDSGERLNVFFGENTFYHPGLEVDFPILDTSSLKSKFLRGFDMKFNPSDVNNIDFTSNPNVPANNGNFSVLNYSVGGGWHNVYVASTVYDECAQFRSAFANASALRKIGALRDVIWTTMAMMAPGRDMADGVPPTEMISKLRVKKPYNYKVGTNANAGYPMYGFKLDKLTPTMNNREAATSALDLINVVPNPYYAYSEYETNETQQIIKITNLPSSAIVNIYSLDGRFIKQYKQDLTTRQNTGTPTQQYNNTNIDENDNVDGNSQTPVFNALTNQYEYRGHRIERQNLTSINWDLKNFYGVPVSSGVYLINVTVPGVGERTLKSFIISRAFDAQRL
jgi:hypothetical protein